MPDYESTIFQPCKEWIANYLLRKMKNAGSLMPVVIKGRGAKYKAVPAKQS